MCTMARPSRYTTKAKTAPHTIFKMTSLRMCFLKYPLVEIQHHKREVQFDLAGPHRLGTNGHCVNEHRVAQAMGLGDKLEQGWGRSGCFQLDRPKFLAGRAGGRLAHRADGNAAGHGCSLNGRAGLGQYSLASQFDRVDLEALHELLCMLRPVLVQDDFLTQGRGLGEQLLVFGMFCGDKVPNLYSAEQDQISAQRDGTQAHGALFFLG